MYANKTADSPLDIPFKDRDDFLRYKGKPVTVHLTGCMVISGILRFISDRTLTVDEKVLSRPQVVMVAPGPDR